MTHEAESTVESTVEVPSLDLAADDEAGTNSLDDLSLEDLVRACFADLPQNAWDTLPSDLSDQHDHYIYGTPKIS